jgi:pyridoxine/pyridoxamine 5'-phosphate oxidase
MPIRKKRGPAAAAPPNAPIVNVGVPRMPAVYAMKPRKQYLAWRHAEDRLTRSHNYWLCTTRGDGRPHAMPVWGMWLDGAFYFGTGTTTQKARNMARNPAVSVHLESGDDVVIIEGTVEPLALSDKPVVQRLDAVSRSKYKMPLMVSNESRLYRVVPRVAFAWTEKDFPKNATRWEFAAAPAPKRRAPRTGARTHT